MPRRRTAPLTALVLSLAVTLGGCGSEEEPEATDPATSASPTPTETATPTETESASESPTASGTRIEIVRAGDSVTPAGERVEAAVGEPITLVITSDAPGELHVHSTPEQEVAYGAGTSEHEVTIDRPGVVEVESHDPHLVVLQLEVR